MYIVTNKQTRPSTDVDFWDRPQNEAFNDYFRTNYIATGKFINQENVISEDGLEMTTTVVWVDEDTFNAFLADPVVIENFLTPAREHVQDNSIIKGRVSAESV